MILGKLLKNQPLQSVVRAAMTTQLILDKYDIKINISINAKRRKIQSTYGWMWEGGGVAKILLSK